MQIILFICSWPSLCIFSIFEAFYLKILYESLLKKNCTVWKNYYEISLIANFSVNRKLWFISPLFLLISRIITEEVTHGLTYVDNNASQLYAIKCFLSPWNGVTISFIKKKESFTSYVLIKAFFISGQLEGVASNFTMRKMASCCVIFSF